MSNLEHFLSRVLCPFRNGVNGFERLLLVYLAFERGIITGRASDFSARFRLPIKRTAQAVRSLKRKRILHEHGNGARHWWSIDANAIPARQIGGK